MNNTLLIEKAYLNGEFISSNKTFSVINPSTQISIGELPDLDVKEGDKFIEAAHLAWRNWKETTATQRANILRKLYNLIVSHREELAQIMTLESGKPIRESRTEVDYAGSFVEWFAEEAKRSYGDNIPSTNGITRMQTIKQGVGVVAAITPWNFPLAMITRKVAPALAAGCSVILRPASQTPFSAIALAKLSQKAGVPKGVFNVVTSKDSGGWGKFLATSPLIRKISFTGSTAVGKLLMSQASSNIKRISLELGGNAPLIVFDDADLDKAVEGAIAGKFRNTGQTCVSINRFYVQDGVYDKFTAKLVAAVSKLKVGDGLDEATQIGPLINAKGVEKVIKHVKDAVDKGAKISLGGNKLDGNFFMPTILTEVANDCLISKEETFGPICALFRFHSEEEAITLSNNTEFGLASYFYSENINRCFRVANQLEAGMVGINAGIISNAAAPFGGVKESGLGREGSKYGLDEYVEIKYLCFGI